MATKSEIEREIESQAKERKQAIYQVRSYLKNPGRFSIFLMGERGTGKSYWVKQISEEMKKNKEKYHNKFVELNCSSLSKDLAESELFGYGKGVFTGQLEKGKLGKFLEAAGYKLDGRSGKVSK